MVELFPARPQPETCASSVLSLQVRESFQYRPIVAVRANRLQSARVPQRQRLAYPWPFSLNGPQQTFCHPMRRSATDRKLTRADCKTPTCGAILLSWDIDSELHRKVKPMHVSVIRIALAAPAGLALVLF